jgi:hypothetical protein
VDGLRKIGRTVAIMVLILAGTILLVSGLSAGAPEMQSLLGLAALLGALGLVVTWFWPTS